MKHANATSLTVVLLCLAASWAQSPADALPAEKAARADAAAKLARGILALRLDDKTTVKDICLGNEKLRADATPLIQGAAEIRPTRVYGDGVCEVRLAMTAGQVVRNLAAAVPGSDEKLKALDTNQRIEVAGEARLHAPEGREGTPSRKHQAGPKLEGLAGWADVPARQRLHTERSAYDRAIAGLARAAAAVQLAGKSVEAYVGQSDAAKAAFDQFLKGLRADRKAYLPEGVVEVEVTLTPQALLDCLKRITRDNMAEDMRLSEEALDGAAKLLKPHTAVGYAAVDGRTIDESKMHETVEADLKEQPKIVLKELEGPK